MTDLDPQVLDDQLHALGARMADPSIPRNPQGYQGRVRFARVVPAVIVTGDDGLEYVADPTEFAAHGDMFFRQYVTLGRKSGAGIGSILGKLLPLALGGGPAGAGVDMLKLLFGSVSAVLLILALDAAVWLSIFGAVS